VIFQELVQVHHAHVDEVHEVRVGAIINFSVLQRRKIRIREVAEPGIRPGFLPVAFFYYLLLFYTDILMFGRPEC
jgi:hypothetical protein